MKRSAPASAGVVLLAFLRRLFSPTCCINAGTRLLKYEQIEPNAEISAAANDGASTKSSELALCPSLPSPEDTLRRFALVRGARGGKNSCA